MKAWAFWSSTTALLVFCISAAKADEAIRLLPPPDSTKEVRIRQLQACLAISQEISRLEGDLGAYERAPLRQQDTGRFLGGGRPAATEDAIPIRYATAVGLNVGQSMVSDRYVLCLLALGYRWPESIAAIQSADPRAAALSDERESTILYDAGAIYRKRGAILEAERLLSRSLEIEEKLSGLESAKIVRRLAELAAARLQLGKYDEGLPLATRLVPLSTNSTGGERHFLGLLIDAYAKESRKRDRQAEAVLFEAKAVELR